MTSRQDLFLYLFMFSTSPQGPEQTQQSIGYTNQPVYGSNQPTYGSNQPTFGSNQPNYGGAPPTFGANQPIVAIETLRVDLREVTSQRDAALSDLRERDARIQRLLAELQGVVI